MRQRRERIEEMSDKQLYKEWWTSNGDGLNWPEWLESKLLAARRPHRPGALRWDNEKER